MRIFISILFTITILWTILLEYSHGEREPYPKTLTINYNLVSEPIIPAAFKRMMNFIRAPFHRIFPATLWCGAGNISDDEKKLGMFFRTDSCCREHDHCDMNIPAGGTLHGLTNKESYTSSACSCDHRFYDCLKTVNSLKSMEVGAVYFNVLGPKCFLEDYPIISCNKTTTVKLRTRCIEYNKNTTAAKEWQWNDNLVY